jgi:hypothetical protein
MPAPRTLLDLVQQSAAADATRFCFAALNPDDPLTSVAGLSPVSAQDLIGLAFSWVDALHAHNPDAAEPPPSATPSPATRTTPTRPRTSHGKPAGPGPRPTPLPRSPEPLGSYPADLGMFL